MVFREAMVSMGLEDVRLAKILGKIVATLYFCASFSKLIIAHP